MYIPPFKYVDKIVNLIAGISRQIEQINTDIDGERYLSSFARTFARTFARNIGCEIKALSNCLLLLVGMVFHIGSCLAQQQTVRVFEKGEGGYACFRIPAIVQASNGDLLAFAEARKNGCSDTGDIDLVLKRSTDQGMTWGPLSVVWDDGDNVCGNPAPIVDRTSGRIVLVACWNLGEDTEKEIMEGTSKDSRRVFVLYSMDHGIHWSAPQEITPDVKLADWGWYATGPCHGIQIRNGNHRGRMVVSANHSLLGSKAYRSQLIYSDDAGAHWKLGGVIEQAGGNESTVYELPDGSLILNMRNYNRDAGKCRAYAVSHDGGEHLSHMGYLPELVEPVCQGSALMMTQGGMVSNRVLFSNPASAEKRIRMTVKVSENGGLTWPVSILIHAGPSAYSDLVQLSETAVGLLYEYGTDDAYETIGFSRICLSLHQNL